MPLTVKVSPSISASLESAPFPDVFEIAEPPTVMVLKSSEAVGASLVPLIVMVKTAVSVSPSVSETV